MVEQVEELGAELKARLLFELRILHHRVVHVYGVWTTQKVPLQIAERARRRQRERGRVDPLVNVVGVDLIRRHHQVGPLAAGHHSSGLVKSDGDVPGRSALRQEPAAHLPSFDQNVLFERERVNAA